MTNETTSRLPFFWGELFSSDAVKIIEKHSEAPAGSYVLIKNKITDEFELHYRWFNRRHGSLVNNSLSELLLISNGEMKNKFKFPIRHKDFKITKLTTLSATEVQKRIYSLEMAEELGIPSSLKNEIVASSDLKK